MSNLYLESIKVNGQDYDIHDTRHIDYNGGTYVTINGAVIDANINAIVEEVLRRIAGSYVANETLYTEGTYANDTITSSRGTYQSGDVIIFT